MNRAIARRVASTQQWRFTCRNFSTGTHEELPGLHADQANAGFMDIHSPTDNVPQYDVAIVGGGMVGMALACSLASLPLTKQLKVAIIDANPALGGVDQIKKDDPPDPRVWDHTGLGYTRYNARDIDKEILGCVVENKVLHRSLYSCLQDKDLQKTIYLARLSSLTFNSRSSSITLDSKPSQPHGSFTKLGLSNGKCLFAKLVVGSDGSKSHVRESAGIKTTDWKYPQNAIICTVEHTEENHCAWQRFLPNGPIALLPVGDNFSNIVWSMNPKEAAECKSMNCDDFVRAVNHALDNAYGPHPKSRSLRGGDWLNTFVLSSANECFELPPKVVKLVSERMVFPLSLRHANSYTSRRVVLIGDAAHTVHPLAGQGVNMGFADVSSLSRVLAEGVAVGSDIGELSLLRRYESERKRANLAMMAILDGIQKGYSIDYAPMKLLRGAAFYAANYISPLKKQIVSYASGERSFPLFL